MRRASAAAAATILCTALGVAGCDPSPSVRPSRAKLAGGGSGELRMPDGTVWSWQQRMTEHGIERTYFDETGVARGAAEMADRLREARESRWADRGALTQAMDQRLSRAPASEPISALGWLAIRTSPRRDGSNMPVVEAEIASARAELERVAEREWASARPEIRGVLDGPLVRLRGTPAQLRALARSEALHVVSSVPDGGLLGTEWRSSGRADWSYSYGYGGDGVRVAIAEPDQPSDYTYLPNVVGVYQPLGSADTHPLYSAAIVSSDKPPLGIPNGSAYDADLLIANWKGSTPYTAEPWAADSGAEAINVSVAHEPCTDSGGQIKAVSYWYDYLNLTKQTLPIFTRGAGNNCKGSSDPDKQYVRNRGYNGLIVGASDDKSTVDRSDDDMAFFSSWRNPTSPNGDRELPEITAPGRTIAVAGLPANDGTSLAGPYIAGVVASMNERNGSAWPEAMKAAMLATADCNVDGPRLQLTQDSVDDKDGVGLVHSWNATELIGSGYQWSFGDPSASFRGWTQAWVSFSSSFDSNNFWVETPRVKANATGRIAVALTWDATPVCPSGPTSCAGLGPDADLNVYLMPPQGGWPVAWSISIDNNYEVLYATGLEPNTEYDVVVQRMPQTENRTSTYMGLAWAPLPDCS